VQKHEKAGFYSFHVGLPVAVSAFCLKTYIAAIVFVKKIQKNIAGFVRVTPIIRACSPARYVDSKRQAKLAQVQPCLEICMG
jgi:hypothetical protein